MSTGVVLEPAIPEHLTTERTQPSNLPQNYQPPFPAYAARFPRSSKGLVMAVVGFQKKDEVSHSDEDRKKLVSFMSQDLDLIQPPITQDNNAMAYAFSHGGKTIYLATL